MKFQFAALHKAAPTGSNRQIRKGGSLFGFAVRTGVLLVGCLLLGTAAPPVFTQSPPWAQKIFMGVQFHDFGTCPHGAQLKHRLAMKNIYAVALQITDIRSSCGCLSYKASAPVLQPKEEGYIDLVMDAARFNGQKSVSLYVTVGPQFVSTAVIQVNANSRSDVVFNPGGIDFGNVSGGVAPIKSIDVEYAGVLDWRVVEIVKSKSAPFTVSAVEMYRQSKGLLKNGKVGYQLQVALNADAPAGFFRQELLLRTNDPASPLLTVYVEGKVQAGLKVTPDNVKFDTVKAGTKSSRKIVVTGAQPFRIVGIDGIGNGIQADWPTQPAAAHVVNVYCDSAQPGDIARKLIVHTDSGKGEDLTIQVQASVAP